MLPAEPDVARGILVGPILAANGMLLVISTMRKHCDFHRQGFCSAEELTRWRPGEALNGFRRLP